MPRQATEHPRSSPRTGTRAAHSHPVATENAVRMSWGLRARWCDRDRHPSGQASSESSWDVASTPDRGGARTSGAAVHAMMRFWGTSGREESRLIGRRCIRTPDPIWRRAKAGPGIGAGRDCKALRRSTNSWPSNSISTSGSTSRAYKRMDQDGRSGAVSWRQRKFKMAEETRERRPASAVRSLRMHGRVGLRRCRGVALGMAHGGKTRRHVCVDRQQGHRRELDHRRFVN